MLFSIVIPTYNRAKILEETLLSVLDQSYDGYEILVVDDGSTDHTRQTVEALQNPKIRYFYKQNEERSIARNYGANKAEGDYLIFLDSDDKMNKTHLESIAAFIAQKSTAPLFIFAGYQILNPDHTPLYSYGMEGFFNPKKLVYGNYLGCSSVIIQKHLFRKHYFNTDKSLILFEDWELWLRVITVTELHCFPGKSIVMMNHVGRSVLNYEASHFNEKIQHFKTHILHSTNIITSSFVNERIFLNGIYSYAALHIAMTKRNRRVALKYFLLSLINNPFFIFRKRCYAIIKHLV